VSGWSGVERPHEIDRARAAGGRVDAEPEHTGDRAEEDPISRSSTCSHIDQQG
jgi:hypothetical protein